VKLRGSATITVAKQTARTKKSFISRSVRVPGIGGYPRNKFKVSQNVYKTLKKLKYNTEKHIGEISTMIL
jgi:hypothetical protein